MVRFPAWAESPLCRNLNIPGFLDFFVVWSAGSRDPPARNPSRPSILTHTLLPPKSRGHRIAAEPPWPSYRKADPVRPIIARKAAELSPVRQLTQDFSMKKLFLLVPPILAILAHAQTAASPSPEAAKPTRYTFILSGNKAGYESSTRNPDGSLQVHFEFNDRGRGPNINEKIVAGKDGIPTEIEIAGVDYLKAPVDERFSLKQGVASWKNRSEQGQKKISGKAFYTSISGASEETALLAQALLAAPQHKLPLLPAGEASIEKRGELKITANGQSQTVTQYAIDGLGFSPFPFWLDADGKLFALVSTWSTIIQEGWENAAADLLKAQDKLENERSANLARTLARKPKGPLVFIHASLFDSESAQMLPNRTVVIVGNKITAVGADGQVPLPKNAETIDASG